MGNDMAVPSDNGRLRLSELCQEISGKRNLILASNRGPVDYHVTEGGKLQGRRGSGGVVSALSAVSRFTDVTWVSSAMGQGDRQAAEMAQNKRFKASFPGHNLYLRFVVSSGSVYHKFYSVICNPLLWFLQHYMWNSSHTPNVDARVHDAWENGYVRVNRTIAEAVIDEALSSDLPPVVMLHDYHLYLAPGFVRKQLPNAIVQHFTHIPWPGTHYWQLMPQAMREAIHRGMCASDIVGMQTRKDVHNFLHSCEAFMDGAEVDHKACTVHLDNRTTRVKHYPVSVDTDSLRKIVASPLVDEYKEKLRPLFNEKTIVRVDRLEPSKNILRGFRA
ncbi:MAG: trehalose-6-phosphate synthase, partial [Chloroflexota bacterium]